MTEALPAALLIAALALGVLRWSDRRPADSPVASLLQPGTQTQSFDAWLSRALVEFDRYYEVNVARAPGPCAQTALAGLYDLRGSIMAELYAQQRFAPNDDRLSVLLERQAHAADKYMTERIHTARASNNNLRAVRWPLSNADGDGVF